MRFGGLSWGLFAAIGGVVVLTLGASFWAFTTEIERLRAEELTSQLLAEGRLLTHALAESWKDRDVRPIAGMVHALRNEGTDVVVMVTDGTVLASTLETGPPGRALLDQPETRAALATGAGQAVRSGIHGPAPSCTAAVRIGSDLDELGVIWLARPRWTLAAHALSFGRLVAVIATLGLAGILVLGAVLTGRWARLLHRLTRAAQNLADGDLSTPAEVPGSDAFAVLARSLNQTRRRFLADAAAGDRQRRTLAALLNQLQEGVIAVGPDGGIMLINPAALRLLGIDAAGRHGDWAGRAVEECLPQHELQRLLRLGGSGTGGRPGPGAEGGGPDEARLRLDLAGERVHVLARAADLLLPAGNGLDAPPTPSGRIVVLTDVTSLHRALEVQTDFVANASHELRTPLSSIRAAVETLLHLDLARESADAGRFLEIIDRQSARLAALAADLLDLSRIQSAGGRPAVRVALPEFLHDLRARFAQAAADRQLELELVLPSGEPRALAVPAHLLRLVLDNLVDNAIQFTEPGGHVRIACRAEPASVLFEVADDGCGIPEADQPRVFERFYQVARDRSGTRRGTGLGLAIVRDAVAAMGGTVRLESRLGAGTRVTVRLPAAPGGVVPESRELHIS